MNVPLQTASYNRVEMPKKKRTPTDAETFGRRLARLRKALQHILSYKDEVWMTLPGQVASHYTSLPVEQQLAAK